MAETQGTPTFHCLPCGAHQHMDGLFAQWFDFPPLPVRFNLTHRMPLYVKAGHKIDVNESMWHMRNHYEGTVLDPRADVGAGAWHSPYRLGEDMVWKYKGASYVQKPKKQAVPHTRRKL